MEVRPRHLRLADGSRTEIEGASEDGSLVVQLVIRTGDFTSQHRNKLMADMFKLLWIRASVSTAERAVLVVTDVVERVIDAGTPVIVTSQCHESEVLLGHYEAGDALARSGAVGSRDMTLEAAYAKVQFLLSQGLAGDDLARWMGRSIAGELSQ